MTEQKRVAVFPAGTEIGLELHQALQYATWFSLFGLSSVEDHSRYVYQNWISGIPFIGQKDFLPRLNRVLREERIDYLYPAHDSALLFLARHREELEARLVAPPLETVETVRSKRNTYRFFHEEDFIPHIYENIEQVEQYPVFIKPDIGQGSQGAAVMYSREEYERIGRGKEELVICEYLPGEECTVDCFTGRDGGLKAVMYRSRDRVRTGISVASRAMEAPEEIVHMARVINARLCLRGGWFFQAKHDANGAWKLLEIAARIAGTSGLTRCMGVNLPLLTLYQAMGGTVSLVKNEMPARVDRALVSRYRVDCRYEAVYVDLDDTLLLRSGRVNGLLLLFLYQAVERGKRLILVTRHAADPEDTLRGCRISRTLFDRIEHVGPGEKKSEVIREREAILIDDSFAERQEVHGRLGIPVFDVDGVESLIDWRA